MCKWLPMKGANIQRNLRERKSRKERNCIIRQFISSCQRARLVLPHSTCSWLLAREHLSSGPTFSGPTRFLTQTRLPIANGQKWKWKVTFGPFTQKVSALQVRRSFRMWLLGRKFLFLPSLSFLPLASSSLITLIMPWANLILWMRVKNVA